MSASKKNVKVVVKNERIKDATVLSIRTIPDVATTMLSNPVATTIGKFAGKPKVSAPSPFGVGEEMAIKIFQMLGIGHWGVSDPSDEFLKESYAKADENLRIFDSDSANQLYLIHYLNPLPFTAHIRGVVIRIVDDQPEIWMASFPHTEEYDIDSVGLPNFAEFRSSVSFGSHVTDPVENKDHLTQVENVSSAIPEVTLAYEGTLLRVRRLSAPSTSGNKTNFIVATHRKLDGLTSSWGGPKFSQQLSDVFGPLAQGWEKVFEKYLLPDTCYVFLLSHPLARVICKCDKPILRLVGIYLPFQSILVRVPRENFAWHISSNYFETDAESSEPKFDLSYPVQCSSFNEMIQLVRDLPPTSATGYLYSSADGGQVFKLVSPKYLELRELRGNDPSLAFRYLELMEQQNGSDAMLRALYPEMQPAFDKVDKALINMIPKLTELYRQKFLAPRAVGPHASPRIPPQEYAVISEARSIFLKKKMSRPTIETVVAEAMQSCTVYQMWAMINR